MGPLIQGGITGVSSKLLTSVVGSAFKGTFGFGPLTAGPAATVGIISGVTEIAVQWYKGDAQAWNRTTAGKDALEYAYDVGACGLATAGALGVYFKSVSGIGVLNVVGSNAVGVYGKQLVIDILSTPDYFSSFGNGYTLAYGAPGGISLY
jgi:hypothetical protein